MEPVKTQLDVSSDGDFQVEIYYTCPADSVGSTFEISFADKKITGKITEAHDPPVVGKELNRVERGESYVKDFKRLVVGTLHLKKGKGVLEIKAVEIPGSQVMDFRLLMLKRQG